jgi:hypothetical protein
MKTFNIKISESGLKTIQDALECYSRLGINQFRYCLEHNPKFAAMSYDERHEIEDYLRHKIDSRDFGIYHPEVTKFNEAFQIKKEIQKNIAISKEPLMEHFTNTYDGALEDYEYIPKFYDDAGNKIKHEISIPISKKHQTKIRNYFKAKDFEGMWEYIDQNNLTKGIRGDSTSVTNRFMKIVISKPYKIIYDK